MEKHCIPDIYLLAVTENKLCILECIFLKHLKNNPLNPLHWNPNPTISTAILCITKDNFLNNMIKLLHNKKEMIFEHKITIM